MSVPMTQTMQEIKDLNFATVDKWVREMSGGFFIAEDGNWRNRPVIRRADGKMFRSKVWGDREVRGFTVDIYISDVKKLDRRNKVTMRAIAKTVREAFREQDDAIEDQRLATVRFNIRHKL